MAVLGHSEQFSVFASVPTDHATSRRIITKVQPRILNSQVLEFSLEGKFYLFSINN